jgi:endonuclease/exonuclease/phosphatase family metal-dependent hydrolase
VSTLDLSRREVRSAQPRRGARRPAACAGLALIAGATLATGCAEAARSGPDGAPAGAIDAGPDGASALRVMTFNFKHAELSSLEDVAAAITAESPDLVALQEVDRDAQRSGVVDQPAELAELTGMSAGFAGALAFGDGGEYGVALLSRWPIASDEKMQLTSTGEQRVLAVWQIEIPGGGTLQMANTHLGLSAEERTTQVSEIAAALAGRERVVLVGDLNENPTGGDVHATLSAQLRDAWEEAGTGLGYTFPALLPTERIDYIFLSEDWAAPSEVRVVEAYVADHLPLFAAVPLAR